MKPEADIMINTRNLQAELTGTQRYLREILSVWSNRFELVYPEAKASGWRGHLWEQFGLPGMLKGKLLWSPANCGPVRVAHQVVTIHDCSVFDHPEWYSKPFALAYHYILPRLAKKVKHVITVSEFSKSRIVEKLNVESEKISVTPLAAEQKFSPKGETDIEECKKQCGIPFKNYFLFVGSMDPRKNLPRLLKAWKKAALGEPGEMGLVIVGAENSIFKSLNMEFPEHVHVCGHIEDRWMPEIYSGALALVYPSLYEGFGLPILESMQCGTPVIASEHPVLLEVTGGSAAVTCMAQEVSSIARALKSVIDFSPEERAAWKEKSLNRACQFNWKKTAEATENILKRFA